MAELQPGVRERLQAPTSGEVVTLIVGVSDPDSEAVIQAVEGAGGEVDERLPYDSLVVSIEETNLDALCQLDDVTTVEIEGTWNPMQSDEGNFRFPPGSNR